MVIGSQPWRILRYLKLGTYFLNLLGLLLHHCRQTRNGAFPLGDSLCDILLRQQYESR
jgi:hypothetical protein